MAPATSQASHCPVQRLSQQIPPTHRPVPHCRSAVHAPPCPVGGTHPPETQMAPEAQSLGPAQVVRQAPVAQA